MRFKRATAVIASLLASTALAGTNSWTVRGPGGGMIRDLVIDPANASTLYASTGWALHKSIDNGASWTALSFDTGNYGVSDLAFDPSNSARLYAASLSRGVFRSTDGGATFTRISPVPTDGNIDGPLALGISADGSRIYYTTISGRFFRSIDSGASFTEAAATGFAHAQLLVTPNDGATVYAASGQQLRKTINGGDSWQTLPLPLNGAFPHSVQLTSGTPATLWVGVANGVYSTVNDGQTWTPTTLTGASKVHADATSSQRLYASNPFSGGALHRYVGGVWTPMPVAVPANIWSLSVSPGASQTIFAATSRGVFRTTNDGAAWAAVNQGLNGGDVRVLESRAGRLYSGAEHGDVAAADGDAVLQPSAVVANPADGSGIQVKSIDAHPAATDVVLAGMSGRGLHRSANGGGSWTQVAPYLNSAMIDALAFDPSNAMIVYAAARPTTAGPLAAIHRSVDGGLTFAPISGAALANIEAKRLRVDPANPSRLFLASSNFGGTNGVFRSLDGGQSWTALTNNSAYDLALDPVDSSRIYAASGGLWVSDSGGDSFSPVAALAQGTYGNVIAIAVDPTERDTVFVISGRFLGTSSEYFILRSVDRAVTWERIPLATQPQWTPMRLAISSTAPNVLIAATATHSVHWFEIAPNLAVEILGHSGYRPLSVASSFDVRVRNAGPYAARRARIEVALPAGLQNVSATIGAGTCTVNAASVQCTAPYLRSDETATARVNYTPATSGALDIQASVAALERDPAPADNSANATATAAQVVNLVATAAVAPSGPINRGASLTYTFTVRNDGPNEAPPPRLTIATPAGLALGAASSPCVVAAGVVECAFTGPLAAGASVQVNLAATGANTGTHRVTATVTAPAPAVDSNVADNSATVDIAVQELQSGGGGGGGGGGGSVPLSFLLLLAGAAGLRRRALVITERS